ncbi:hypothetical protein F5Y15DRAFT_425249 [Xylariaceae sp. FL0016]|nr:hypothetical protein F5Y15DRAFT_425249 [Xylariaceae sp. FL0016]
MSDENQQSESSNTEYPPSHAEESVFEVRKTKNKGLGCFAKRHIRGGDVVHVEAPYATRPRDDEMTVDQFWQFMESVHNIENLKENPLMELHYLPLMRTRSDRYMKDVYSNETNRLLICRTIDRIFLSNCFGIDKHTEEDDDSTIHATLNVQYSTSTGYWVGVATRDIQPGEEMTISYTHLAQDRDDKHEIMRKEWGFTCDCHRCRGEDVAFDEFVHQCRWYLREAAKKGDLNLLRSTDPQVHDDLESRIYALKEIRGLEAELCLASIEAVEHYRWHGRKYDNDPYPEEGDKDNYEKARKHNQVVVWAGSRIFGDRHPLVLRARQLLRVDQVMLKEIQDRLDQTAKMMDEIDDEWCYINQMPVRP